MLGVFQDLLKMTGFPIESTGVCQSQTCLLTSASILHDLDKKVDPCTDFYQYSCGGWIEAHKIRDDQAQTGSFDNVSEDIQNILKQIFENTYDHLHTFGNFTVDPDMQKKDEEMFNKAKNYYESCNNEAAIDSRGSEPIRTLLEKLNSIWEDSKINDIESITSAMSFLISNNANPFFSFDGDADAENPGVNTITLGQSGLQLPSKQYYTVPATIELYKGTVKDIWSAIFTQEDSKFFGANHNISAAVDSLVKFETALASISNSSDEMRDPVANYNPMSIKNLTSTVPNIDWQLMVSKLQASTVPVETIIVQSPQYLANLGKLIAETDVMTVRYHFINALIFTLIDTLSTSIRAPNVKFSAILDGTKVIPPRWETCMRDVGNVLGQLVGRYYAITKFGTEAQSFSDAFLHTIRDSLEQRLKALDFLDDVTRQRALDKLHKIVQKVGYSKSEPDVMSPESLDMYYKTISSIPDKYFDNYLSYLQWDSKRTWEVYGKPVNRLRWGMNPQDVNAYYNPLLNEIVFPAGILQIPFFDLEYPSSLNYGGIGAVMGHELTHAFDDEGRQYDEDGRIASWWLNATAAKFDERAQCFVNQYSAFTVTGSDNQSVHVNGKLTLGENLADNGGVLIAFNAWRNSLANATMDQPKSEQTLPGLEEFTPEQLFFINYGRIWCQNIRPEKSVKRIYTDPHSPNRWRVNGVAQNSDEFAKAFKCPPKAPMNTETKCHLW
ncbi:hypothetical protein BC943DRAFT_362365 [Umbelopsis sp. AD052]|nr:hypothetical protein BC943DRAFT_362365 [Umbelopsis sp. AD052]